MNEVFATYLEFELEIGRGGGREYPVTVLHSPAGEAQATMHFPYDEVALEKRLVVLQNALLGSGGQPSEFPSPEELVVRNLGRDLFAALLTGEVRRCYEQSLEQAWAEDVGLRVKLRIQPSELAALPWEFLYDPRQDEYVCLSRNTPLVRHLDTPQAVPPPSLSPPLRVLGMIASPVHLEPSDMAREKEPLEAALRGLQARGLAELTWVEGQTSHHVQEALGRGDWHAFHLFSQGAFSRGDPRGGQLSEDGGTALNGEEGEHRPLSAVEMARLLAGHPSLYVALLNARLEVRGSKLRSVFTNTAELLVRQGIPAVLATSYAITDKAATVLFRALYEAMALGVPVDVAVAEGRKAVSLSVGSSVEWGAPALFLGSPDQPVFDIRGEIHSVEAQVIIDEPRQEPVQPETPAEVLEPEAAPATTLQETAQPSREPRPKRKFLVHTPQPIEPELVPIPAGEFLMGSDPERDQRAYEAEQPQHPVHLPDYSIARTPITNAQYAAFVEATNYERPKHWIDGKPPSGKEDYPVVYVSWRDAMNYCRWLSKKNGRTYRLPSEAEWEKAARGTDGRIYPWGDAWDPGCCNSKESGIDDVTLVDAYADGASPYGILDMAGNMWEWTRSLSKPYPYHSNDGREDLRTAGKRVLRGGAFYSSARRVRCAYRDSGYPDDCRGNYGFRVMLASS